MALNYNTENFTNISKDVNTLLAQGRLLPEQMAEYLKEEHGVEKDEWNEAVDKALAAEKKYFEMKEKYEGIPLASANMYMPAHLRETEESTFRSILEFPERAIKAGLRSSTKGIVELGGMALPEQLEKTISDEMKDFDDYLSENKLTRSVWDSLKQTFDPATSTAEEVTGFIASLGMGTAGATRAIGTLLPRLGGVTRRTSGFVAADLLLSDKNENLAKFLVTQFPETAAPLEILAIDETDSDAIKLLKKAVEAAGLGLATEGLVRGVVAGFKGIKGKVKAREDNILKTPQDDTGGVVETQVVRGPTGEFEHKVRMEQPVKILGDPKVGKEGGLFGKWAGSRQGLDRQTFRAYERKSGRGTEAEAKLKNQSNLFIRSLEKTYKKKLKNFTDDEVATLNVALGRSLGTEGGAFPKKIQNILKKKPAQRTKKEKAELKAFRKVRFSMSGRKGETVDVKTRAEKVQAEAMAKLPVEVQEQIVNMRGMVDDYTRLIIKEGIPGKDLVGRLDHNLGFYISTDYELFSNPAWLKSIKRILNKDAKATGKPPATDVEAMEAINSARKWYKANVKDSRGKPLSNHEINVRLKGFINNIKEGEMDFFEMMVPGASNVVKGHQLGKILTRRKPIPEDLKALYREVTDPSQRFRSTIRKQARVLAENEFANSIKTIAESPYGRKLFYIPKAGKDTPFEFTGKLSDIANNYLKSVGSNPLANILTTPSFQKTLTRVLKEGENPTGVWGNIYRANAIAAGTKTILSHPTHLINIQGNFLFSMANGNLLPIGLRTPTHLKGAARTVGAMLGKNPRMGDLVKIYGNKVKVNMKEYEELQALGLLDSGVNQEYFLRAFKNLSSLSEEGGKGITKWLGKKYRGIGRIYRAEDGIFKAYNYYAELARYRKAFPKMPEAELKSFAAERVKDTLPTYGRIPMSIKVARRTLPMTAFPSFLTESIRVSKNALKYAITDTWQGVTTGNLQLMRIGAERLGGVVGAALAGDALYLQSRIRNGITSDDEDFIEESSPIYAQHMQRTYIGPAQKNPKDRNHIQIPYINISRNDPIDATKQIVYTALNHVFLPLVRAGEGKITWDQAKDQALQFIKEIGVVAQPILTPSLVTQGIFDYATGKRGKDPHVGWVEEIFGVPFEDVPLVGGSKPGLIYETFEPGSATAIRQHMDAIESSRIHIERTGKPSIGRTKSGFPDDPEQRKMRHYGIGMHTYDYNRSLQFAVAKTGGEIRRINKELTQLLRGEVGKGAAGYDWNNPARLNEFYEKVDDIIIRSFKEQQKLAIGLQKASKFSYQEIVSGRVVRRTVGLPQVEEILSHEGMKKIDPNFGMAIVNSVLVDRVGMFDPPDISDDFEENYKVREQDIPKEVIEQLRNYIDTHFRSLPLLHIEEEE